MSNAPTGSSPEAADTTRVEAIEAALPAMRRHLGWGDGPLADGPEAICHRAAQNAYNAMAPIIEADRKMSYEIVSLASLARTPAEAEIVANTYGGYAVYGWTHILRTEVPFQELPLRLLVSRHTFKIAAKRAMKRWLEAKRWEIDNQLATTGGTE